jgi:16S rRNA processing protein RimM
MLIEVAKLGKTVGLRGYLKLHLLTDFSEQFQAGTTYQTKAGPLTIEDINKKQEVKFRGFDTKEEAAKLTNLILSISKEESEKACTLGKDEFFWYDIIGLSVYEGDELIGEVKEIERYPMEDHLLIIPTPAITERTKLKRFLLPYTDRIIKAVDLKNRKILVTGAREIIDALA